MSVHLFTVIAITVIVLLVAVILLLSSKACRRPCNVRSHVKGYQISESVSDDVNDDSIVGSGNDSVLTSEPIMYRCTSEYHNQINLLFECIEDESDPITLYSCHNNFMIGTAIHPQGTLTLTRDQVCNSKSVSDMCLARPKSVYDSADKTDIVVYGRQIGAFNWSNWKSVSSICPET